MDFTDLLDQGNDVTSKGAAFIRDVVERVAAGAHDAIEELRPFAEQLDTWFADAEDPPPAAPEGGVPTPSTPAAEG